MAMTRLLATFLASAVAVWAQCALAQTGLAGIDRQGVGAYAGPPNFVNLKSASARDSTLWFVAETSSEHWSQSLRCPKGPMKNVSFHGALKIHFGDRIRGHSYRYYEGSDWNDRPAFSLGRLIPDDVIRIAGDKGDRAWVRFQCRPYQTDADEVIYRQIESGNADGSLERPQCTTTDRIMTCQVLAPHLYRLVTNNVWELSDFGRQQQLVDAHNNRLKAEIVAQENRRQAEVATRVRQQEAQQVAQVTQQKAVAAKADHKMLRMVVLSIAGIIILGVLLVVGAAHLKNRD